jgi:hypothetical protein
MTIRSTLTERLRLSSITSSIKYFLRDLIDNFLNSEDVNVGGWDDLRFPATAVNPPGLVSDPAFDTDKTGWLFDATGTEQIQVIAQIPHAWKVGTTLKPHIHWEKTTSATGNVFWQLDYVWSRIGEARDASITLTGYSAPISSNVADVHQLTELGNIPVVSEDISDILVMKLSRVGNNSNDTYGADARLLEFDIHHQVDSFGSTSEFSGK